MYSSLLISQSKCLFYSTLITELKIFLLFFDDIFNLSNYVSTLLAASSCSAARLSNALNIAMGLEISITGSSTSVPSIIRLDIAYSECKKSKQSIRPKLRVNTLATSFC